MKSALTTLPIKAVESGETKISSNPVPDPCHQKQFTKDTVQPSSHTRFTYKTKEMEKVKEESIFIEATAKEEELHDTQVSATTKALNQIQEECKRPKCKSSSKVKRKKRNEKLAKILIPKNALILLNEIKPGCVFITKEKLSQGKVGFSGFSVQVKHEKDILGTGQGFSKSQAKNLAAEDAIRTLFFKTMKTISEKSEVSPENTLDVFPWAGLAQFAMYKMFSEWQLLSQDSPQKDILKFMNFARTSKSTLSLPQPKKEIPPNAQNLHPTTLLNHLFPGLMCVELERTVGPPSRVKVAFEVDGKQFCGVAANKKEAKKEAAKLLLSTLYGVEYKL